MNLATYAIRMLTEGKETMRNSILVRSIAAVSGIVMLASVAACGDNTAATDSSSAKSSTTTEAVSGNFQGRQGRLQPVRLRRRRLHLPDRRHRMGRLRCRPER